MTALVILNNWYTLLSAERLTNCNPWLKQQTDRFYSHKKQIFPPSGPPEVKRLCGSGAVGQSVLLCGEIGKLLSPLRSGFGCLKLLLSENSDWDSAAAASKGERTMWPVTLLGTTRLGLLRPGGGDGESLPGSYRTQERIASYFFCPLFILVVSWRF